MSKEKTTITKKEKIVIEKDAKQGSVNKTEIKQTSKKQELMRALKFFLFSCSAGVIQFATFTVLSEVIGWDFWPSHLIALVLSVVWNFTFNRKFTFKSAVNVPKAMLFAFLFYVPFTPATVLGGQALVNIGWNSLLVEALTMVLNLVLEFFWSKYITFRNNIDTASKDKPEGQENTEVKENVETAPEVAEQPAVETETDGADMISAQPETLANTEQAEDK